MRLQTARQGKNEGPQELADRCRAMTQNIMCQDSDPAAQKIHRENTERILLGNFVSGLSGEIGRQFRFQNPQNLHQALTAIAVREAVKQKRFSETFYTKFDKSVRVSNRGGSEEADDRYSPKRATSFSSDKRYTRNIDRTAISGNVGDVQERAEPMCYECEERGHFARK